MFLAALSSLLLYIPVNRYINGGVSLESDIDKYIPLIPIFTIPYLIGIIFWPFSIIYINLKGDKTHVKRFNIAIISASILSVLIYVIYPTFVVRPEIANADIFSNILSIIYANDRAFNAAPSGHTFYTILSLTGLWGLMPRYKAILFILAALIIAATMFTKQHNFMDIIAGFIFAAIIFVISNKIDFKYKHKDQ